MRAPQNSSTYVGVGPGDTPLQVLVQMADLGERLARSGWTLRSGGARGADAAFEAGHRRFTAERLEIYLPWRNFNQHPSPLCSVSTEALELAARVHPAWASCGEQVRKLHGRAVYQVMGPRLDTPCAFIVCWTQDGARSEKELTRDTGGAASAIALADRLGVPVFNLARLGTLTRLVEWLALGPA